MNLWYVTGLINLWHSSWMGVDGAVHLLYSHSSFLCHAHTISDSICVTLNKSWIGYASHRLTQIWLTQIWLTQIWMSHGLQINESCPTHVNESWLSYEWVMSHTWMSHVSHMNEREWVMMNESWLTYVGLIAHVSMSHGTHINKSWLTYKCAVSIALRCLVWGGYD